MISIAGRARALLVVSVMASVGCASLPIVSLDATPADFEMLAGQWEGEYVSPEVRRSGSIQFTLSAGAAEARGDVLMYPERSEEAYYPAAQQERYGEAASLPRFEVLTIRFVRADHGEITGVLDRYWDPDRKCAALTTFRGRLVESVIEGTFTTNWECGFPQAAGRWKVTRKRAS